MHPTLSLSRPTGSFLVLTALVLAGGMPPGAHLAAAESVPVKSQTESSPAADEPALEFLKQTAVARLAAIELGRIAAERDSSPSVSTYAKGMTGQESLLLERLQAVAGKLGVTLPVATNEKYAEKLGRLEAKSQPEFEKMFWNFVTELYERDLVAFEFGTTVQNLEVRQFAVQYRDMFQRQIDEIKERTKADS